VLPILLSPSIDGQNPNFGNCQSCWQVCNANALS
jgi:hypothetical protein